MKLGIIGLPQCGKTTIFEALTHNYSETAHKSESRIGTIKVPDLRVDRLSQMYNPKKTIYAQVEYFLPGMQGQGSDKPQDQSVWTQVRDADALIHVVRNFGGYGFEAPIIQQDFEKLDQELIINDLVVTEKRLERLELDQKRGKKATPEELVEVAEKIKKEM
jgi:ribosome-binding ATPase YchF (GTP1/OBG family)